MATQVTAFPQAQAVSAEALQQLFGICDNVAEQMKNGAKILAVPVNSVLPLGSQAVEVLKERLEAITSTRFTLASDQSVGAVLFAAAEPMPVESPENSADPAAGLDAGSSTPASTPGAEGAAPAHKKKAPRPKNAFMIYRLDHHAPIAAQNPGMHNNDISKIIGAKWRNERPHIREEYNRRAEEEKRQHAIDHPGYRYQPRKPSEKKKRMTKNKLAKLAASSGSIDTTTDATTLPAQSDAGNQFASEIEARLRDGLPDGQIAFDTFMSPYQNTTSQLTSLDGLGLAQVDVGLGVTDFSDQFALLNVPQQQATAGMFAQQGSTIGLQTSGSMLGPLSSDLIDVSAAALSSGDDWVVDPIITSEAACTPDPFAEQRRQEQLDLDMDFNAFINQGFVVDGDEFAPIPDDFDPASDWVLE